MTGWTPLENAAFHAALLGYFVTGVAAAIHVVTGHMRWRLAGTIALSTSFGLLTLLGGWRAYRAGELPFGTPAFDMVFLGYALTGTLLVFDLRFRLPFVRASVTPLVVAIFFLSLFAISKSQITTHGTGFLLMLHIGTSLAALALLLVASVLGLLYLRSHARLKARATTSSPLAAPSLDRLDRLGQIAIGAGFLALTLSLLIGALYGRSAGVLDALAHDPRVGSACALWVALALLSHFRSTATLSARRGAQLTLLAAGLLVILYVAMRGGLHG